MSNDKIALRRTMRARRDALNERAALSAAICVRLAQLPLFRRARAIHCYLPFRSEVDTRPLIAAALGAGQRVAVPIVVAGQTELAHSWLDALDPALLTGDALGIPTPRTPAPASPGDWTLTIVPLLAFDRSGRRLGYGKGFYDRLLTRCPGPALGVAFAAQEVPCVPAAAHDIPLAFVITELETIVVGPEAADIKA